MTAGRRRIRLAITRRVTARRRLRRLNLRRVRHALRAPIPPAPPASRSPAPDVPTTYGAPRTLLYVTVKRDNPSWRALYGHWWLELDGRESYGWWPAAVPLGPADLLRGTGGVLNGVGLLGLDGTWFRDPHHGQPSAHEFHPVLRVVRSDEQVRRDIRRFAHAYRTPWRWHWSPDRTAGTCRGFQDDLFAAVGLGEGVDQLHTRGSGCPFLYQIRRPWWWLADRVEDTRRALPCTSSPSYSLCPTDTTLDQSAGGYS